AQEDGTEREQTEDGGTAARDARVDAAHGVSGRDAGAKASSTAPWATTEDGNAGRTRASVSRTSGPRGGIGSARAGRHRPRPRAGRTGRGPTGHRPWGS